MLKDKFYSLKDVYTKLVFSPGFFAGGGIAISGYAFTNQTIGEIAFSAFLIATGVTWEIHRSLEDLEMKDAKEGDCNQ